MSQDQYIYDYYNTQIEYDTFHSLHSKKLSENELDQINNEIKKHFEDQENNLSVKRKTTYLKIKNMDYRYRKMFICSPWVRGFCFFQTKDCIHAHGIDDLVYDKHDKEYNAQQSFEKIDMKDLTNNLNYLYLYEFCKKYDLPDNKSHTLDAINNDRTLRTSLREYTRTKLFEDFYLFLRFQYPDIFITEQFLVSEFTRIGVGSDALGFSIKSGRISAYLMKHMCYHARCYHPPGNYQFYGNYMILKDRRFNISQYFKEKVISALKQLKDENKPFVESRIREIVINSQVSELEPSFEVYLIKDNMCLFRFLKSWAINDESFLKSCTEIFEQSQQDAEQILSSITFDCCSDGSEKIKRKNKLIEEYLLQKYNNQKKKYCRYWLRGLCIFTKEQCQYSHGSDDLIYQAYDEHIDDPEYKDFMSQKPLWKYRSYVSLYNEQEKLLEKQLIDKISTQQELDDNKELRESIRDKMQTNAMEEFVELIWKYYGKQIIFTESFIIREFSRVGFFQIGYTLRNQMIIDIIVQKKLFASMTILPPLINKKNYLFSYPPYEDIVQHFVPKVLKIFQVQNQELSKKQENEEKKQEDVENQIKDNNELNKIEQNSEIKSPEEQKEQQKFQNNNQQQEENEDDEQLKNNEQTQQDNEIEENEPLFTVNEYLIRKEFYKEPAANIPPLHLITKHYQKQLSDVIYDIFDTKEFIEQLIQEIPNFNLKTLHNSLLLDSDTLKLQKLTNDAMAKKSEKSLFNLNKLFFKIYPIFRPQVRATIGMTKFRDNFKSMLVEKYHCDIYNMGSKILALQKKVLKHHIKQNSQKHSKNQQNLKQDQSYRDLILQEKYIFKETSIPIIDRIIVISTQEEIDQSLQILLQQSIIGVDLEGNLSKHGKIELIQISYYNYEKNHAIIYVFDFLTMEKNKDLFQYGKNKIKEIMEDKSIIKILQGCQKDALALFHLFQTKIVSGLDTQIVHNFLNQAKIMGNNQNKQFIDHQYYNCGLNIILQIYNAPNGLNPLKNKFQAVFTDHEQAFYYMNTRPINEEFLIYSSKDVEDLIPVYFNILKSAIQILKTLYDGIDIQSIIHLLLTISNVTTNYKPL